jgi:hypothetical protein
MASSDQNPYEALECERKASGSAKISRRLGFTLLCVIAGYLVRLSVFRRMSDWLDDKLASFIPGYTDLKKETKDASKDLYVSGVKKGVIGWSANIRLTKNSFLVARILFNENKEPEKFELLPV